MKPSEIIELSAKGLALLFAIGLLLGGIVCLRYCLHINYYPPGVGAADSLFFISASLMVLVIYGFYIGLSLGLSSLLLSILRRPYNWTVELVKRRFHRNYPPIGKIDESVRAPVPVGLLAALILLFLYLTKHPLASAASVTVALYLFLLLLLSSGTPDNPEPLIDATTTAGDSKSKRRVAVKWAMIGFIAIGPLVLAFVFLAQMTMQSVGIYIKEADVALSGNSAMFARQAATQGEVSTERASRDELLVLSGVEVLWTGVGSHTAIRVRDGKEKGVFVFPNSEVLIRRQETISSKSVEPTR